MSRTRALGIAIFATASDLLSKHLLLAYLWPDDKAIKPLLPILNLRLAWNRGVSFSWLNAWGPAALITLSAIIAAFFLYCLLIETKKWLRTGYALIVGGAVGNMVDRLRYGAVMDFLDVHWQNWHFPTFNLADTWITLGVILILFETWIRKHDKA